VFDIETLRHGCGERYAGLVREGKAPEDKINIYHILLRVKHIS